METTADDRQILDALFQAALDAARPLGKFGGRLPNPPSGRTIVVGAGKAAASMAQAFEAEWPHPVEGLVVTRYGHSAKTRSIEVVEASHPVPDAAGEQAALRILDLVKSASPDDLVIALISGGASALLSLPAPGLTLQEKQALTSKLLRSGAPISAMNEVRKALSAIKGGRLAAASRAPVVTYVISDVPGDDPAIVGSGPTIARASPSVDPCTILDRYGIEVPAHIRKITAAKVAPERAGDAVHVIATARMALDAAALAARRIGLEPLILGDAIEGEAREVGVAMAGIARSVLKYGTPVKRPCVILSGGETTVTIKARGRGGRNTEFLLSLALALDGTEDVSAMAADTDGIDGSENNAGAWFDPSFVCSASKAGFDLAELLAANDAYGAFVEANRLVVTGPTLTNVNDFRAILIR
ncbi:glycerate kinase [Bradyrhizobium sp. C-145]|uniref:glycerate kinase type-2 family protein n=1 Tax=Bradyrhizobium sp. C-145 TaxID=574727 RepID=UPI00201B6D3A|nr:glycerate kinase [Bradyrhizobium sp. C-145]UQR66669.1 glycerate kinase [Bradyrhizobium sp. C-145]